MLMLTISRSILLDLVLCTRVSVTRALPTDGVIASSRVIVSRPARQYPITSTTRCSSCGKCTAACS